MTSADTLHNRFAIEIATFAAEHRRVRLVDVTREAVVDAVREAARTPAACIVIDNLQSTDSFLLWLASDRARVRMDLHRDWHAIDASEAVASTGHAVEFRDDDGSVFVERREDTVARERALEAFWYWLMMGGMDSGLRWA